MSRFRLWVLSMPCRVTATTRAPVCRRDAIAGSAASGVRYWSMSSPPVGSAVGSGDSQPVAASRRTAAASVLYCHGENSRMWRHCSMAAAAARAGLEDQRLQAALEQVRCRGEADGPGSDDSYGKVGGYIHGFLCFIRWWRFIVAVPAGPCGTGRRRSCSATVQVVVAAVLAGIGAGRIGAAVGIHSAHLLSSAWVRSGWVPRRGRWRCCRRRPVRRGSVRRRGRRRSRCRRR